MPPSIFSNLPTALSSVRGGPWEFKFPISHYQLAPSRVMFIITTTYLTFSAKHSTWIIPLFISIVTHTGANFITMLVTRARANSSKNHTLLMCRIWKMGRNLFSSLDIRDNFKVAFLEKKFKQSKNLSGNYHCLGHWQCNKLSQSLMLITRSKSGYLTKFAQKMPLSNY